VNMIQVRKRLIFRVIMVDLPPLKKVVNATKLTVTL
jgi:hypothetical protein